MHVYRAFARCSSRKEWTSKTILPSFFQDALQTNIDDESCNYYKSIEAMESSFEVSAPASATIESMVALG